LGGRKLLFSIIGRGDKIAHKTWALLTNGGTSEKGKAQRLRCERFMGLSSWHIRVKDREELGGRYKTTPGKENLYNND